MTCIPIGGYPVHNAFDDRAAELLSNIGRGPRCSAIRNGGTRGRASSHSVME